MSVGPVFTKLCRVPAGPPGPRPGRDPAQLREHRPHRHAPLHGLRPARTCPRHDPPDEGRRGVRARARATDNPGVAGELSARGVRSGVEPGGVEPVSYTHLTLPTN